MKSSNEFLKESKRKEQLLDNMVKLSDKHLKAVYKSGKLNEAYYGEADILSIYDSKVKLYLVDIDKKVNVQMGHEVCSLLKQKDQLILSLGKINNSWYLMDIDMVITPINEPDGVKSLSVSQNGLNQNHMFH